MAKINQRHWSLGNYIFVFVLGLIFSIFFSYKLLEVPSGLTVDEAAFGYNAALLAKTGHDERGLFMPFFVLSINGQDWRQPVTQYYLTILFKIFGSSVFLLRFSSILIFLFSFYLLILLAKKIFKNFELSIFTGVVFATTPLIMIQSHMGLDNIMPIPFTILWLFFLNKYKSTKKLKYILFSAVSLGINFYTYKGMRAVAPIWSILSVLYIYYENNKNIKRTIRPLFVFCLGLLPFFGTISLWEKKYPGSIFNGQSTKFDSIYNFVHPYLSSFDLTFLFIKGDNTPFHSTGIHGMMLLATLPLFIVGAIESIKKHKFILISFFTAPLLYGFVNSVHRASRLMCLISLYSIICTVGFSKITQHSKYLKYVFYILIIINFLDFSKYYLFDYCKRTADIFGNLTTYKDIKIMGEFSKKYNFIPYLDPDLASKYGESEKFFAISYMDQPITLINNDNDLPSNGLLLSHRKNIDNLKNLDIKLPNYFLHTK